MIKEERQDHILDLLNEHKFCSVSMIANTLYVAPITVRRDLAEMDTKGIIKRCHGGATLKNFENREIPFELRTKENSGIKSLLAKKAAEMIQEGDTVFMDASSTVLHIADYLHTKQNLTVITNSIKMLEKLKGKQILCYLTGGMLLENSHALVGNVAEETISSMYADLCFFSSQGITEDGVITDFSDAETKLRKQMIRNAKKSIFLYDQSKVGKRFLFKVCDSHELSALITNDEMEGQ